MKKGAGIAVNIVKMFVIILLIAVFALLSYSCYTGSNDYLGLANHSNGAVYDTECYEATSDKAMILIPGLMASTLYDTADGSPLWGYSRFGNLITQVVKMGNATLAEKETFATSVVNSLSCDENNVPLVKERVGTMSDSDAYGSFNGMKYIYNILEPLYGEQYDIVVWQYDWRQSNTGSALELERFINYNGYDEVMFFTHSMGGVVVSNYLARREENREKTKLFVPFGCPLLGSMDAVNNLYENQDQSGFMVTILNLIKEKFNVDVSLNTIARNLASVYELLPSPAYDEVAYYDANSSAYVGTATPMYYEGESVTCEEMLSYMYTYSWAKKSNGEYKPVVAELESYFDSLYVEVDGVRTFVTDTVPTEYIVGVDVNTLVGAYVNSDGVLVDTVYSMLGDGTVPAYSATAGHALTDSNVHLVYGITHGPLANGEGDLEGSDPEKTGLQYLKGIMAKYISKTDAQINGGN